MIFYSFLNCPFVLSKISLWSWVMIALPERELEPFMNCPLASSKTSLRSCLIVTFWVLHALDFHLTKLIFCDHSGTLHNHYGNFHFAKNIRHGTHPVTKYNPGMFGNHHIIICSPLKMKCCIIWSPQKAPPYNICKIWCQYFGEDYLILRKK